MIGVGDTVRVAKMPSWVSTLPKESRRVLRHCHGKVYRVDDITDQGLLVLDVSDDVDAVFGGFMNDIRLEPEYVELAERSS